MGNRHSSRKSSTPVLETPKGCLPDIFYLDEVVDILSQYLPLRDLEKILRSHTHTACPLQKIRRRVELYDTTFGLRLIDSGFVGLTFLLKPLSDPLNLRGLSEYLRELDLSHQQSVTDSDLEGLVNLTSLNLWSNYRISDNGLRDRVNLTSLDLWDNKRISNQGLQNLVNLVYLVNRYDNKITEDRLRDLQVGGLFLTYG